MVGGVPRLQTPAYGNELTTCPIKYMIKLMPALGLGGCNLLYQSIVFDLSHHIAATRLRQLL